MPNISFSKTKTIYPVSIMDAKLHLRVDMDYTNDDGYILNIIKAATREAENYIGKDIAYTTTIASLHDFYGDYIRVNEGNFKSALEFISDTSANIQISGTRAYHNYFEVFLGTQVSSTTKYTPAKLTYITGYTDETCPDEIKQAILIKVGNMYDVDRQDDTPTYLKDGRASDNLLNSHKIILY